MVGRDVGQVAVWDVRRRKDGPRRLFDDSTGVIAASLRLQVPQPPLLIAPPPPPPPPSSEHFTCQTPGAAKRK